MNPLISCVMPTKGRPAFALESVRLFCEQTYEPRELVIADDRDAPSFTEPPERPMVRYLVAPSGLMLGEKRNWVNGQAHGEIIAHWDDDDWYAPERLFHQYGMLVASQAAMVGYGNAEFRSHLGPRWNYRAIANYALGATMMYWKATWEACPFPDKQVGSDTVWQHSLRGKVYTEPAAGMFFARNHGANLNERNDEKLALAGCWERIA